MANVEILHTKKRRNHVRYCQNSFLQKLCMRCTLSLHTVLKAQTCLMLCTRLSKKQYVRCSLSLQIVFENIYVCDAFNNVIAKEVCAV